MLPLPDSVLPLQPTAAPPLSFPDRPTCRVRSSGFGAYYDCLNVWVIHCPFALRFGSEALCRCPSNAAMAAWPEQPTEPTLAVVLA